MFKGKKDYAGWNLEALECGLVHPPINDADSGLRTSSSDDEIIVVDDAPVAVSMWG